MNNSDYNKSFTAMVGRHEKIIFSVCFFYATNEVSFDDLRQEVLISLYKGYSNFRQEVLISLYKGYSNFRHESSESTWVDKVCISVIFTESLSLVTKQVSFTHRTKLLLSLMSYL